MISNIEKLAFYIPNTLIKINDISGLFSGFQDNPETAFNDGFYSEVIEKKKEFEKLAHWKAMLLPLGMILTF